jgi:hypothetical protein
VARAKVKLERESAGQALSKQQVLNMCCPVSFSFLSYPSNVLPLFPFLVAPLIL